MRWMLDSMNLTSTSRCGPGRAHDARQVTEGSPPTMRVDALVAAGNALASAADLATTPEAALQLLHGAGDGYAAALARDEDAGTLSNAADAWVAAARLLAETGRRDEAAALFSRAMAAYQRSCERSSSEEGDDLPGRAVLPAAAFML